MRRPNKWIVIDGCMSRKTKEWLHRLINENTVFYKLLESMIFRFLQMFPWRELPIIALSERVIIETDSLESDIKSLPMILLDTSEEVSRETTLEITEQQRIDEVLKYYSEFKYRKYELIRKISGLKLDFYFCKICSF